MLRDTDFLNGIVFEENPFANEDPAFVQAFDLHGNEVSNHEAE